jgi:hypothetical protein
MTNEMISISPSSTSLTYVAIVHLHLHNGVYISQLIRYARVCSTYDQFLLRGSLLTHKLISQRFLQSRLQAAFRNFYSRYNDILCPCNLLLGHLLFDTFHTNRSAVHNTVILTTVRTVCLNWK